MDPRHKKKKKSQLTSALDARPAETKGAHKAATPSAATVPQPSHAALAGTFCTAGWGDTRAVSWSCWGLIRSAIGTAQLRGMDADDARGTHGALLSHLWHLGMC